MANNLTPLIDQFAYADLLRTVGTVAAARDISVYSVGGVVRDLLLGLKTQDLDFVTVGAGTGIRLARSVAHMLGGTTVHVYDKFGTAAIRVPVGEDRAVLEFVAARRESYRGHSRKPDVEGGTLEEDLKRRDFTVNAMAVSLEPGRFGLLLDPHDGQRDLEARQLRTPLPPGRTFRDDPLRMVRAARFAAQLDFMVDADVLVAMRSEGHRMCIVSQERVTEELERMMLSPAPSTGWHYLEQTGLLKGIFPELARLKGVQSVRGRKHKDNFLHTLKVLNNVIAIAPPDAYWLRWAALLHDIAKPRVKRFAPGPGWTFHGHEDLGGRMVPKIFQRLRLPLDERMEYVRKLVALHHRPVALVDDTVTDSAVRRLLFDAGDALDDLMLLVRADITSRNRRRVERYLRAFDEVEEKFAIVEEKDHLRNFQPPVDGKEIMEAIGIGEGIAIGIIKHAIREAILEGSIPNEHAPAHELMLQIKDEALRRAELFDYMMRSLKGPERRAIGAIKQELFSGAIPPEREMALQHLYAAKDCVLHEATDVKRAEHPT